MSKLSESNLDIGIESLPVGFIFPVLNQNTPPSGTLVCDGSLIATVTYADLFSGKPLSLGAYYGAAPAGQFYLPDIRGRGLRGVSAGSGRDPDSASRYADNGGPTGNVAGSMQDDQFDSHSHNIPGRFPNVQALQPFVIGSTNVGGSIAIPTSAVGGNETRMKNAGVLWVIKY